MNYFSAPRPELGATNGRLTACPSSPNCVSSQASPDDRIHFVEPFRFLDPVDAAMARLAEIVRKRPRTRILEEGPHYLRAEFRTLIFRFVDDVEFLADAAESVIHVRSASRIGHSDLGTNRRRVESLRQLWTARSAN